jgi:hypothetical protein
MEPKLPETIMLNKISLKGWIIIVVVVFILSYSYFRLDDLLRGPRLVITSPTDGADLEDPLVTVTGKAERISKITFNGHPIFTDEEGNFSQSLLLSPGYNILVVAAEDRFDRHVTKTLRLTRPRASTATTTFNYF